MLNITNDYIYVRFPLYLPSIFWPLQVPNGKLHGRSGDMNSHQQLSPVIL